MCKEIHEQPQAVADTLLDRRGPAATLDPRRDAPRAPTSCAASTRSSSWPAARSYHAALVAKYAIEHWVKLPAEVDIASEFRYRDPVLERAHARASGVSPVGRDRSTPPRPCARRRASGAKVLVVSNVVDSSMAREADGVLYTRAGPEIGVASTKCHLAQIVALEMLGLYLAQIRGTQPAGRDQRDPRRHGGAARPGDRGARRGRATSTTWRPS